MARLGLGVVGCGTIAEAYAAQLVALDSVDLVGVTDLLPERAEALAARHGACAYPSLEALLADDAVEAVVNLTVPEAHAAVTAACLEAGRHVYSEKPLALTYRQARLLVELAAARGLRLACSPCTLLGEAQQTAWKVIREGRLGPVRVVYAEANGGRVELWHPAPEPFYAVGPLFDIGVYPLTLAVVMLGPARSVRAAGGVVHPRRSTAEGVPFAVVAPDFEVATVQLEDGALVRLTASFYVARRGTKQAGMEFHGDLGSLHLSDWQRLDAAVEVGEFARRIEYRPVPLVGKPYDGTDWGRGVDELARAVAESRPHRLSGELAAHVVEIVEGARRSLRLGRPVEIRSRFTPPPPMPWAG